MMKPPLKQKGKRKEVKAWAVLDNKGKRIVTVEMCRSKPQWFTIGTWKFETREHHKIVPVTITYHA